jgi:hypothetical protein
MQGRVQAGAIGQDVTLRDISASGCSVHWPLDIAAGMQVALTPSGVAMPIPAHVARKATDVTGLMFSGEAAVTAALEPLMERVQRRPAKAA